MATMIASFSALVPGRTRKSQTTSARGKGTICWASKAIIWSSCIASTGGSFTPRMKTAWPATEKTARPPADACGGQGGADRPRHGGVAVLLLVRIEAERDGAEAMQGDAAVLEQGEFAQLHRVGADVERENRGGNSHVERNEGAVKEGTIPGPGRAYWLFPPRSLMGG